MRPIHWLHISDFHLKENQTTRQNAVLDAMLKDIKRRHNDGLVVDFVLVTGDLAFSGSESEYGLSKAFLEKLSMTIGRPRQFIFCVPGNHDVDRDQQRMCFAGARQELQNQTNVYSFIENKEERTTLLKRLSAFRRFQESFFSGQKRTPTEDSLGYVADVVVDDIRIAIMGLNSAWLSEGGPSDDRQLLLGEQQVTNAISLAKDMGPHFVIGMVHHPFDTLREFDRMQAKHRLEDNCDFLHGGHLHTPDASSVVSDSSPCLVLAAGAAYESREFQNSYTLVRFEPLHERATVTFIGYNTREAAFSSESKRTYIVEVDTETSCTLGELSTALEATHPPTSSWSYYLSALLLGFMSEVPILADGAIVLGTIDLLDELQEQTDTTITSATHEFLTVRHAIALLYGSKPLPHILADHRALVENFATVLCKLCEIDSALREQLVVRNDNARHLAGENTDTAFRHTSALLDDLLAVGAWDELRKQAERAIKLSDRPVTIKAKRMLVLCLANSTERADRERAVVLYQELAASPDRSPEDWAGLATLLTDDGNHRRAKETVIKAIQTFPQNAAGFVDIGMKTVEVTGDVGFRDWLLRQKTGGQR